MKSKPSPKEQYIQSLSKKLVQRYNITLNKVFKGNPKGRKIA